MSDTEKMTIPEAAVEAAAKAYIEHGTLLPALEAAAPHMLAEAWDRGFLFAYYLERGYEDDGTMPTPDHLTGDLDEWNPHRPTK